MDVAAQAGQENTVTLSARGLTKIYQSGEVEIAALDGIDLDLYAGEMVVLLGASGSGKSTLLNILGGLDAPTRGEVFFHDQNITATSERALTRYRRDYVGFVFQFYNLISSLTARENVALVTDIAQDALDPVTDHPHRPQRAPPRCSRPQLVSAVASANISALDIKLLRDIWHLKAQVLSIALVIGSGVALLVMALSTYEALRATTDAYYDRYRFADVFATVKRAPRHIESRLRSVTGVQTIALRISQPAILDVDGFEEPLMGRLTSVPEGRQPKLNRLVLSSGRLVAPDHPDEVVINVEFATAHGLSAGDPLGAIINGKKRYGILWMGEQALEAAYDYDGAFNDLSLTVLRGTDTRQTIAELDTLLAPYGGVGAIDRKDHVSDWFVQNELAQNQASARVLPTIFLLVAAFLTNTVLSRLIATERREIGLMKAFGYSNREVGWHYAKFVIAVATIGILLGSALGAMLGQISTDSYARNLNLPLLIYRPSPMAFLIGAMVSIGVALAATFRAVNRAAKLAPSVAMNPPEPPSYSRGSPIARSLLAKLDEPTRIIARQITRWPLRSLTTAAGFAGAIAMMILSLYFTDAIDEILRTHFNEVQREDLALGFIDARSSVVIQDVLRLPGVIKAEPMRIVPADLVAGHREHRGAVSGLLSDAALTRIYDLKRGPLTVPDHGVVLSARLAEKLGLAVGDTVEIRVLEGRRPVDRLTVIDTYESHVGLQAYVNLHYLNALLRDRPVTQYVNTLVDETQQAPLLQALKNLPAVSTVAFRSSALQNFNQTIADTLMIFVGFFSAFSFALGFGVTYNTQRIALSERGRELATMRVLGFSQREALYMLLGEVLLLVAAAIPLGCLLGWALTAVFINAGGFQTELMRLPLFIEPATFGTAIVVLLAASLASGLAMRRLVYQLDLIAVLKTRE
jgi:putative ABC transport system permease protein